MDIEQLSGKKILAFMHGAFSLSAAAGALCFGAYRSLGLRAALGSVVVVGVVVSLLAGLLMAARGPRTASLPP